MSTDLVKEKQTQKQKIAPPKKWNVVFHNDDFTPFDIVIMILVNVFKKSIEESEAIALQVHQLGKGVAGQYTLEIAQTKQKDATAIAQEYQFPLLIEIEEA